MRQAVCRKGCVQYTGFQKNALKKNASAALHVCKMSENCRKKFFSIFGQQIPQYSLLLIFAKTHIFEIFLICLVRFGPCPLVAGEEIVDIVCPQTVRKCILLGLRVGHLSFCSHVLPTF